jgi:DNA-binding CsgD family transcriptional regulator/tetratricopeptide (TPR) repeat protein
VRLFVDRARTVLPEFAVTPANRAAVARLCQRLDGLPLAIELAAARLRVLTVQQIEARLGDRFALLTTGARLAPGRHRTLRATLDWSHELCSPAEQALWARASVFAGFDLAAVEAVCSGDGIELDEVFEVVSGLLDKSVLVREYGAGPTARYGMLETVRQYGRDLLAATGQDRLLRRRHRAWFADLSRRAATDRVSPREVEWLRRLRVELPNLRLAMQPVPGEPGAAHEALSIAVAAQDLWLGAGRYREGQRWLTRALDLDEDRSALRANGLALAGNLTNLLGDVEAARRMLTEAQALADRLGDRGTRAVVAMHRAQDATLAADLPRALSLVEEALSDAQATGDLRTASLCHLNAAVILSFLGDPRALEHAEQLQQLGERNGAEWTRSWGLLMHALVRWQSGEGERAAELAREALPVMRLVHDSFAAGACLEILAWQAAASGRYGYSARLLGACEGIRRRDGAGLTELGPLVEQQARCAAEVRRALGDETFGAAADEGRRASLEEAIDHALGTRNAHPVAPRRAGPEDRGGLTRREAQIADLVAEGLTNKEIARRLVISQRTAESHIEHILAKLGFTSRAQIARWATERRGAGGAPN